MVARHDESFGDLLRRYRLAGGLTQEELAMRAGLSVRGLIYLEQHARRPYRDTVRRLAAALALDEAARIAFEAAASPDQVVEALPPLGTLPQAPGPLIGRDEDLSAVTRLMHDAPARLLTVMGPPGVGKTHLAIEAAHASRDAFADGAAFVALAPISDPTLLLATVARALGVSEQPGRPMHETLHAALRERELLLVLDNCEHLLDAASEVAALLAACAGLRVLATSRAALRLRAERPYPLAPLPLPDLAPLPALDELSQNPAVALFTRRAQAVKADFALTADNAAAVAEVCTRLDGLPLGLELAAARVKMLAPRALLARLDQRLPLLAGGARDLPERQQTLRGAIAWSYDLLAAPEQALFRRLSVFAGGATLEAIAEVCTDDGDPASDEGLTWRVEALLDQSLLRSEEAEEEEARFTMLETIREYARERLADSGEEDRPRARHASYYVALAERAEPELRGAEQTAWVRRLEREHNNMRAVLDWAAGEGPLDLGLRLAGAIYQFWLMSRYTNEGRRRLADLLAREEREGGAIPAPLRLKALTAAGLMAWGHKDLGQARVLCEAALAMARAMGATPLVAFLLITLAAAVTDQGDYMAALALYDEGLSLSRALGDVNTTAYALNNVGWIMRMQGHHERSLALLTEAATLFEQCGDTVGSIWTDTQLAWLALDEDDLARAAHLGEEALTLSRKQEHAMGTAQALLISGSVALTRGDFSRAAALGAEGLALNRDVADARGTAWTLCLLGHTALAGGDAARAPGLFAEGLALNREAGIRFGVAMCLEGLACAAMAQGSPEQAARLFGAADALREELGTPRPASDRRWIDGAREASVAALGDAGFNQAWSLGRALSPQDAASLLASNP